MTLVERLNVRYMKHLFSTPEGRAHVLSQAADSEASGEAAIFEQTLKKAEDPDLARLIGRHRDDELRHEQLFRARVRAQGVGEPSVPEELKLIGRIDEKLGGILSRPISGPRGVLEAYSLLQALEERAVFSFKMFIAAFETTDPESAHITREVLADEERHLKYCVAVARRYARDEAERLEVLDQMRRVEGEAFRENQLANMKFTLERGWIGGRLETLAWTALRQLLLAVPLLPPTPEAEKERWERRLQPAAA